MQIVARNFPSLQRVVWLILIGFVLCVGVSAESSSALISEFHGFPWWGWALILFVFCFFLGILAIVAGLGGGILYVPIVAAVFPFHLDFVRGAGLLVALTGAVSAAPRLLKKGMAPLRLVLPLSAAASVGALLGANAGLGLPQNVVETSLGFVILLVVAIMLLAKNADQPFSDNPDKLATRLGIYGQYRDDLSGKDISWNVRRLVLGFFVFFSIGFIAGMFGLGAGWANVPALNLVLALPLKVSAASSSLIIAMNGATSAWIYLNNGAVLPIIAIPSAIGMMMGTRIGAGLLSKIRAKTIRSFVVGFLILAGLRSILSGLGVFG